MASNIAAPPKQQLNFVKLKIIAVSNVNGNGNGKKAAAAAAWESHGKISQQ